MNLMLHINFKNIVLSKTVKDIDSFKQYLSEIMKNNQQQKIYDQGGLEKIVNQKWDNLFYYLPEHSYKMVFRYIKITNGLNINQLLYLVKFTINKIRKK
jgi:hypothetical protein